MVHGINSSTGQRMNTKLVFNILMKQQANTRVELARMTGLSQATISNIVNSLISIGLIYEYPMASNRVGRRSIGLNINYDRFNIIHLRITSSQFSIGRFNLAGKQYSYYSENYSIETLSSDILNHIKDYIHKISEEDFGSPILGVGISLPTPYNNGHYFEQFSELKNWNNINICKEIQEEFHLPVFAENDANIGALSEWQQNTTITNRDTLVYITLAEGTGCGIISNGSLLRGNLGLAGEIGHMTIDINGPLCKCGKRGCLELYTSTSVLKRIARERSSSTPNTILTSSCSKTEFFQAVLSKDPLAVSIFEEAMEYLSIGVTNLVYLYNPSVIIFGDEMILQKMGDFILDYQKKKLASDLPHELFKNLSLKISSAVSDSAFLGAGALVMEHINDILYDYHIINN